MGVGTPRHAACAFSAPRSQLVSQPPATLKTLSVSAFSAVALLFSSAIPTPALGQDAALSGRPTADPGSPPPSPEEAAAANSGQLSGASDIEVTTLEQGPIHEAFAAPVGVTDEANDAVGTVIQEQPPEPVNEVPPAEKPEGANVQWIPGYWMWSQEREDFIWISGVWRSMPPGRTWTPGSWVEVDGGYAWSPGFWVDGAQQQVAYLPAPPNSLEEGPSSPAPGENYFWVPGCWVYQNTNYNWRPGYWYASQPGWVWTPSYYCHTPRGYVYVGGYWDYPLARRGVLYAPVYWNNRGYRAPGYAYRPRSVIDAGLLITSLFVNPGRQHYYYGSYGPSFRNQGYYPWFSYSAGNRGYYDPFYAYYRSNNRANSGWDFNDLKRRYDRFDDRGPRDGGPRDGGPRDGDRRDGDRRGRGDRGDDLVVSSYRDLVGRNSDGASLRMQQLDRSVERNLNESVQKYHDFSRRRAQLEQGAADNVAQAQNRLQAQDRLQGQSRSQSQNRANDSTRRALENAQNQIDRANARAGRQSLNLSGLVNNQAAQQQRQQRQQPNFRQQGAPRFQGGQPNGQGVPGGQSQRVMRPQVPNPQIQNPTTRNLPNGQSTPQQQLDRTRRQFQSLNSDGSRNFQGRSANPGAPTPRQGPSPRQGFSAPPRPSFNGPAPGRPGGRGNGGGGPNFRGGGGGNGNGNGGGGGGGKGK